MNLERGSILFNRTIDQCRSIGRRGGRTRARNLRARKTSRAVAVPVGSHPEVETARQAIERILPRAGLMPRLSPYVPDGRAASV